jgi:hypothetical protein
LTVGESAPPDTDVTVIQKIEVLIDSLDPGEDTIEKRPGVFRIGGRFFDGGEIIVGPCEGESSEEKGEKELH